MKILAILATLLSTSFSAFAHPPVESYNEKTGRGESAYLGLNDIDCSVKVSNQAFEDGSSAPKITLEGFDSWGYTNRSHFTITTEVKDGVYLSEYKPSTGCGDFGGMIRYKKTLELTAKKVSIVESYFCLLDLEKRVIDTTCHLE